MRYVRALVVSAAGGAKDAGGAGRATAGTDAAAAAASADASALGAAAAVSAGADAAAAAIFCDAAAAAAAAGGLAISPASRGAVVDHQARDLAHTLLPPVQARVVLCLLFQLHLYICVCFGSTGSTLMAPTKPRVSTTRT